MIPAPLRPSKSELRKASLSKCKEQAKEKFLKVYDSNKFLFKEPSSQSCSRSRSATPLVGQAPIARITAPTPDHWAGSLVTIPRYFPNGPNWGKDFPLSEAGCIYLWNSGIVLSVEPRETLLLAMPKELDSAKGSDSIECIFFSRPQAPIDLTNLFWVVCDNLKDIRDNQDILRDYNKKTLNKVIRSIGDILETLAYWDQNPQSPHKEVLLNYRYFVHNHITYLRNWLYNPNHLADPDQ